MAELPWFRVYNSIVHDKRTGQMTRDMKASRAETIGVMVSILCAANVGTPRGTFDGYGPEELADDLGMRVNTAAKWFETMEQRGFIGLKTLDNPLAPVNCVLQWEKRQHESDSAAQRMREYRARLKDKEAGSNGDALRNVTNGVTYRPDHTITEQNKSDHNTSERKRQLTPGEKILHQRWQEAVDRSKQLEAEDFNPFADEV